MNKLKLILLMLTALPIIASAQVDKIKRTEYISDWADKINLSIDTLNRMIDKAYNQDLAQYTIYSPTRGWYAIFLDGTLGNDANIGNSWAQAKKTWQGVCEVLNNRDFAGGFIRIWIKPGTYQAYPMRGVNAIVTLNFAGKWVNTPQISLLNDETYKVLRHGYAFGEVIPGCVNEPIIFEGLQSFENCLKVEITSNHRGGWNTPPGFVGYSAFIFNGSLSFYNIDVVSTGIGPITINPTPGAIYCMYLHNVGVFRDNGIIAKLDSANANHPAGIRTDQWSGVVTIAGVAGVVMDPNPAAIYTLDSVPIAKKWQIQGYRQYFSTNAIIRTQAKLDGALRSIFDFGTQLSYSKGYLTGADTMLTIRLNNTATADLYYRNGPTVSSSERVNYVLPTLVSPGDVLLYNRATNTGTRYNANTGINDSINNGQVLNQAIFGTTKLRNTTTIGTGDSVQVALADAMPTDVFVVSYVGKYTTSGDGETAPSAAVVRSGYVTLYGVNGRKVNYVRIK